MSYALLCSVSDDRQGRKGGLYEATQRKMNAIFNNNDFGLIQSHHNIADLVITDFWEQNKVMLNNIDASRNGRLYKPFVISEELKLLKEGDFLIYSDCSPEMWKMGEDFVIDKDIYDTEVIKSLTIENNDFLVSFVKWAPEDFKTIPLGIHTHHYFTLEPCIEAMQAEEYRHSFQCASGMICIRKTGETVALVDEWLAYNRCWKCACIGNPAIEGDESLWHAKEDYKLGQRSDQSILSILLNRRNWDYVDIVYNDISPYNFLNFCRKDVNYKFINSNIKV